MLRALFTLLFSKKVPDLPHLPTPKPTPAPEKPSEPRWLTFARNEIGFRETGTNRGIERYIVDAKTGQLGDPWCAIFVNAMLERSGVRGTRSAMARSFETSPHFVRLKTPGVGTIATMWRVSRTGGLGHVFFPTGIDAQGRIWGIGGNENDGVREVPHDPSRIVGYYAPKGVRVAFKALARVSGAGQAISTKEV